MARIPVAVKLNSKHHLFYERLLAYEGTSIHKRNAHVKVYQSLELIDLHGSNYRTIHLVEHHVDINIPGWQDYFDEFDLDNIWQ